MGWEVKPWEREQWPLRSEYTPVARQRREDTLCEATCPFICWCLGGLIA